MATSKLSKRQYSPRLRAVVMKDRRTKRNRTRQQIKLAIKKEYN